MTKDDDFGNLMAKLQAARQNMDAVSSAAENAGTPSGGLSGGSLFQDLQNAERSVSIIAAQSADTPRNVAKTNLELSANVANSNAQYAKLAEYLQSRQATGTTQEQITNAMLVSYITHHMLELGLTDVSTYDQETAKDTCGTHTYNKLTDTYQEVDSHYVQGDPERLFFKDMSNLIHNQLKTNFVQMKQDAELRERYVKGTSQSLQQMSDQQQTTIALLTQLSEYVNEQVGEYSGVYERLSTLIDTYKRKAGFKAADVQTLSNAGRWCRIAFWTAVAFLMLMVIVEKFEYIARATAAA